MRLRLLCYFLDVLYQAIGRGKGARLHAHWGTLDDDLVVWDEKCEEAVIGDHSVKWVEDQTGLKRKAIATRRMWQTLANEYGVTGHLADPHYINQRPGEKPFAALLAKLGIAFRGDFSVRDLKNKAEKAETERRREMGLVS